MGPPPLLEARNMYHHQSSVP
jgi:hypothetical protein